MTRSLDLDLVRTFATVADCAGMTAAANVLHLTQGAVSQQVKRLETLLGCKLFERDRRGLRLTQAGERLLPKARRMLDLNDDIWAEMAVDALRGNVRIGVPYDLAGAWLAPVLKTYAEACPLVEISLHCAASPELVRSLARGEVDLAVVEEPIGQSQGECLRVERLVWVGARYGGAYLKSPLPVSMVAETCAFRPAVLGALQESGRRWRTVFENGSLEATTATVRADLAVTAWLASTVPPDLDVLLPGEGLPSLPLFAINLHMPKRGMTAPAVALARALREGLVRAPRAA